MGTSELSPEARRRLWECYRLLLELAEQAEPKTIVGSSKLGTTKKKDVTVSDDKDEGGCRSGERASDAR